MSTVATVKIKTPTFLSDHLRHLIQTDLTILMSVRPIMIFSMPSIFRVRIPSKTLARSIPYHRHPLAQRGRDAGLAARQMQGLRHGITELLYHG